MSEAYNVVAGRRVVCCGCHHQDEIRRVEGGIFDAPGDFDTYFCDFCDSIIAVCLHCGASSGSGTRCHYCNQTRNPKDHDPALLPSGISPFDMVKVPNQYTVWEHKPSGRRFSLPPDWEPPVLSKPKTDPSLSGKKRRQTA